MKTITEQSEVKTDLRKFNQAQVQISKGIEAMEKQKVETEDDLKPAVEIQNKVQTVLKLIETKRKELTKPLYDAQKRVNQVAKELTDEINVELAKFKGKINRVNQEVRKKREEELRIERQKAEEERLRLLEEAKKGEKKLQESVDQIMESQKQLRQQEREIKTSSPVKTRRVWTFEVVDPMAVPREFLMVNESLIRTKLPKGDETPPEIPGIKFERKESVI